ncbi:hypothetical protein [Halobacteriovorax sp. RZ-2]|uniref:hypothetical protein n=1 Tax=unclassified Halobacteriovorax TaxID=2639665 RepID=UPI0037143074
MIYRGLILLFLTFNTLACLVASAPKNINISISPLSKGLYIYDDSGTKREEMPNILASNCLTAASNNHYTMITVGIENYVLTDKFLTYSINDKVTYGSKDFCRIENLENINGTTKDEREQRLLKRRRIMNRCLEFEVNDVAESGIEFPKTQSGCKVTRIDKNKARFQGYYCFFKPSTDSAYIIKPIINEACLTNDFYTENEFELQDILASIGIYVSGDATGRSPDLKYVKDFKLRLNQSPEGILAVNKTIEPDEPKFPIKWPVNDIQLGKLYLTTSKDTKNSAYFGVPLFVRNTCEKKCEQGKPCTAPCNYTQPIAAEFVLTQLAGNGKKHYVTSWFDGGIAPANWTGLINGIGTQITSNYFEVGKDYELEVILDDQEYNFMMFKGRIKSRLNLRPTTIPAINREGRTIGEISPFSKVEVLKSLPSYPVFDAIKFTGNSHLGVKNTVNSISRVFDDPVWPPYFSDYCINGSCVLMKDHMLRLKLKFKVTQDEKTGELISEVLEYKKEANLQDNKTVNNYTAPYFTCTPPGKDPTDDDSDDDFGDIDF